MSFLLSCPHCGPRPVDEYAYFGEVTRRPTEAPSLRELGEYVYFRDNVAGVQREWWQHRAGCGEWFLAERDTRTNEVLEVSLPQPERRSGVRPVASDPVGSDASAIDPTAGGGEP
jgi:heterotetrameric sarcosine oxidase delta subunit